MAQASRVGARLTCYLHNASYTSHRRQRVVLASRVWVVVKHGDGQQSFEGRSAWPSRLVGYERLFHLFSFQPVRLHPSGSAAQRLRATAVQRLSWYLPALIALFRVPRAIMKMCRKLRSTQRINVYLERRGILNLARLERLKVQLGIWQVMELLGNHLWLLRSESRFE